MKSYDGKEGRGMFLIDTNGTLSKEEKILGRESGVSKDKLHSCPWSSSTEDDAV